MKKIKLIGLLTVAVLLTVSLVLPCVAVAQGLDSPTNLTQLTNSPASTNAVGDISNTPLPATKSDFWAWGLAFVVPAIVMGIKKLAPNIPPVLLPLSTPVIGFAIGWGLNALGATQWSWLDMGQAGAAGVMIREAWDQAIKPKKVKVEKEPIYRGG